MHGQLMNFYSDFVCKRFWHTVAVYVQVVVVTAVARPKSHLISSVCPERKKQISRTGVSCATAPTFKVHGERKHYPQATKTKTSSSTCSIHNSFIVRPTCFDLWTLKLQAVLNRPLHPKAQQGMMYSYPPQQTLASCDGPGKNDVFETFLTEHGQFFSIEIQVEIYPVIILVQFLVSKLLSGIDLL